MSVDNILSGKSRVCKCTQTKYTTSTQKLLADRYYAIQQRCTNPSNENYANYGARGIECKFQTPDEFIAYILRCLPHQTYRGVDIGRINNNGNYETGNLQLETRTVNLNNTMRNVQVEYKGVVMTATQVYRKLREDYPSFQLSVERTRVLLSQGVSWQEVLRKVPRAKRS